MVSVFAVLLPGLSVFLAVVTVGIIMATFVFRVILIAVVMVTSATLGLRLGFSMVVSARLTTVTACGRLSTASAFSPTLTYFILCGPGSVALLLSTRGSMWSVFASLWLRIVTAVLMFVRIVRFPFMEGKVGRSIRLILALSVFG